MRRLLLALFLVTAAVQAVEVQLVFDDKADEEKLKAFGARSVELIKEWEPKIAVVLGTAEAKRPKQLTVRFKDMDGVAFWDGKAITVSSRYAAKHPDDVMLVVHELTHVLQGYRKIPGWMTEGIADYVRFGIAEEGKFGIRLDPTKNKPRDSYRVTGYLILQAEGTFDINTVFAGILVLTAFALVLDFIVGLVEKRLMVWQPRQGETERI